MEYGTDNAQAEGVCAVWRVAREGWRERTEADVATVVGGDSGDGEGVCFEKSVCVGNFVGVRYGDVGGACGGIAVGGGTGIRVPGGD